MATRANYFSYDLVSAGNLKNRLVESLDLRFQISKVVVVFLDSRSYCLPLEQFVTPLFVDCFNAALDIGKISFNGLIDYDKRLLVCLKLFVVFI